MCLITITINATLEDCAEQSRKRVFKLKKIERRKTLLIQKDVQIGFLKLISILYLFVLLSVSVFWLALIFVVIQKSDLDFVVIKETISNNFNYIGVALLVQIVTMLMIIYYMFARFTHKVCGPIFSVGRTIKKMNEQKTISHVRIRKDDFYQDFVKDLDYLVQNISDYKKETVTEDKK